MSHRLYKNPAGPTIASTGPVIHQNGLTFRDLEKTGTLVPYEDWRLTPEERAADLAARLTIDEIAGLMIYSPHQMVPARNFGPYRGHYNGKPFEESDAAPWDLTDEQKDLLENEHTRNILAKDFISAEAAARWNNNLQALAESLPHGIPVMTSTDPRNGVKAGSAEFKTSAADISEWPEGMGMAATFDPDLCRAYASIISKEYRALGITMALSPQADLSTDPRWMRLEDTYGSDPDLVREMVRAYCEGMQETEGSENGWGSDSVCTMVKHWPGGGTGEGGRDAHYPFGKIAVYPGGHESDHLVPFLDGAFNLTTKTKTAGAVMPYYTVSWNYDTKYGENVGNSYSRYILGDLLRGKYAYDGIVCTDWGITQDPDPAIDSFGSRCYGVETLTEAERHFRIIDNGADIFGGNRDAAPIIEAYRLGTEKYGAEAMRARFEASAVRVLTMMFRLGLFENPYLDPETSAATVGCEPFRRAGYQAQLRSVVLVKNETPQLVSRITTTPVEELAVEAITTEVPTTEAPAAETSTTEVPTTEVPTTEVPTTEASAPEVSVAAATRALPQTGPKKVYIPTRRIRPCKGFLRLPVGTEDTLIDPIKDEPLPEGWERVEAPDEADLAVIFIESPISNPYQAENDPNGNGYFPITLQYRPYTAVTAREESIGGGDFREASPNRSYRGKTNTAANEHDLDLVLDTKRAMGEKHVIVVLRMHNPTVPAEFEPSADAILVEFGVSRQAIFDIITGKHAPTGRLPIEMPASMEAVESHCEDTPHDITPYTDTAGHTYTFHYGLTY